jgi:hypothetical protein
VQPTVTLHKALVDVTSFVDRPQVSRAIMLREPACCWIVRGAGDRGDHQRKI